jgi:cyclic-di-GMP phosphodiesterase TipF (flagellum assembly factor)
MDLRWPILAGSVAAAGGAAAGAWFLRPEAVTAAGAIGLGVAAIGAVAFEMASRNQEITRLRNELRQIKIAQHGFESDISVAKDGMIAVHHVLAEGGGAQKQKMQAMADEVSVLQKLVTRLQISQSAVRTTPVVERIERPTAGNISDAEVLDLVRAAVAEGAVELYLQPIVTLPQRRKRYYECFSRISDDRGGVLAASAYVGAAEAAGLIAPIDNLLLFRAVQLVRRARNQNAHVGFFCNVSRHTLTDSGFLGDFVEFLEENSELAPSLVLEIAQRDWDPADRELARYMQSLASIGVRFSMDRIEDFAIDGATLRRRGFTFLKVTSEKLLSLGLGLITSMQ